MREQPVQRGVVLLVASLAVLTALTVVFTIMIRIPIPATKGYFNLSDVAIFFAAFALGPVTAALAGGVGPALADVIAGFPQWAPVSLVAHGLEGLVAGLLASVAARGFQPHAGKMAAWWIAAGVAGCAVRVAGYLAGGFVLAGAGALGELPFNVVQSVVGAAVGAGLALAVRRAYPPIRDLRW